MPVPPATITSLAFMRELAEDSQVAWHQHHLTQVSYCAQGSLYVVVDERLFLVPPRVGVIIPAQTLHYQAKAVTANVYSLYFPAATYPQLATTVSLLPLSALAELIFAKLAQLTQAQLQEARSQNLIAVLIDELASAGLLTASLPLAKEPRLQKLIAWFSQLEGTYPSQEQAANYLNMTARSLARLFQKELAMSFLQWKQQFIYIRALELLQQSLPLNTIAWQLGYASESAFISMFKKKSAGLTPSVWRHHLRKFLQSSVE